MHRTESFYKVVHLGDLKRAYLPKSQHVMHLSAGTDVAGATRSPAASRHASKVEF